MRSALILLVGLCFLSPGQSFPEGIDDRGDRGCICHGGEDETTEVIVSGLPEMYNLVVNINHPLVSDILNTKTEKKRNRLIKQSFDLAKLSQNLLHGEELTNFIKRSYDLIK